MKCNRTTTLVLTKLDFTFRPNQTPCKKMQIRDLIESATAEQYVSTLIKIFNCPFTQLVAKTIYHCCCALYVCIFVCVWYVYMYLLSVCPLQLMSNIYRKPMHKCWCASNFIHFFNMVKGQTILIFIYIGFIFVKISWKKTTVETPSHAY